MNTQATLKVQDLRVNFKTLLGQVQAVRGVSLEVHPGEVLGVVGESGSGKSVSFLAMMGLLPPSAKITGSAKVNGIELIGAKTKVLREARGNEIAMIFQDPLSALNPVQRIGPQIVEMIRAHQNISKAEAMTQAVEALDMVGIPQPKERAHQYPHEFSGGMRQRVMIAMAIVNKPKVLIADEPTTALDVTVQAQILDVLERIRRDLGTAIVLITHDLGVVARVADRVQVMYAGRIVEKAAVDPLFYATRHPYTAGLLSSLPATSTERLHPIPGAPPNMLQPPSGCAFRPRCSYAVEACAGEIPELARLGDSETACIRAADLELKR
jgi:oligopeptide/dipeptide ABC transporter ATP-binding protein